LTKPIKRKTTLKWFHEGELSTLELAMVIDLLANEELTKCVLSFDTNKKIFGDTILFKRPFISAFT